LLRDSRGASFGASVGQVLLEAIERIEAIVGKNRMAEFIREAVEKELKRREAKAKPSR